MRHGLKKEKDKNKIYVEFDNGKKFTPKDIADMVVRLRKTNSMEEIIRVISLEYKFTFDDIVRFKFLLKGLSESWEFLDSFKEFKAFKEKKKEKEEGR